MCLFKTKLIPPGVISMHKNESVFRNNSRTPNTQHTNCLTSTQQNNFVTNILLKFGNLSFAPTPGKVFPAKKNKTYFNISVSFTSGVSSWCNGLRNRSMRVRNPVALLRSLLDKYPWERCKPSQLEINCITQFFLKAGFCIQRQICH